MHFQGKVDVHGAAELRSGERETAVRVQRVPEHTRLALSAGGKKRTLDPAGVEIRFVLEEGEAEIVVSSNDRLDGAFYFGDFDSWKRFTVIDRPSSVTISIPPKQRERTESVCGLPDTNARFSPRVVRMQFHGQGELYIHDIKGKVRPPTPEELPERCLLTYGTSITQWANASNQSLTWPAQCAWRLGTDLINLGIAGNCFTENAIADHIAERTDWDIGVFALSVNMVVVGYTLSEFESRVCYLIERVAETHPQAPLYFVSLFSYFADWGETQPEAAAGPDEFRACLQSLVSSYNNPKLHNINGKEMLDDPTGLTADMIHPSDFGMITIGERVARTIREFR